MQAADFHRLLNGDDVTLRLQRLWIAIRRVSHREFKVSQRRARSHKKACMHTEERGVEKEERKDEGARPISEAKKTMSRFDILLAGSRRINEDDDDEEALAAQIDLQDNC
ncbi:hypothetical protein CIHG_03325 [Coccidioides immitis H538.4]|uniref:Uncharacterized protein n=3 Tax=Coccidioides immitis TaxID=5501 RepID=A0A0J8QNX0_COCIT|nr:hypothetical protein CIRG_08680 [Coccidioides immitis RMSCC 2394]KMU74154.1 hypothetical protein CISG_04082 [Coccidioides immitis RMSCC 3703]KMU85798.1 hypothetical protein CIHG_03325 [Coccidioides immitis H538.4]